MRARFLNHIPLLSPRDARCRWRHVISAAAPTGFPTLSASGAGGTLPSSPTTYYVEVVALTLEGYQNSSLASGVAVSKSITGPDGKSYVMNGGSSALSAEANTSVTLGNTLFGSVTPTPGAVAYEENAPRAAAIGDDFLVRRQFGQASLQL
jgi:hypothetical protein